MSRKWQYARPWLGIWSLLLLLAACTSRGTAAVDQITPVINTVIVEGTHTPPVSTPITAVDPAPSPILPHSLAWDPSARWLAYASSDGQVWLYEGGSGMARSIEGIEATSPADLWLSWSPKGENLLVYGEWGSDYPRWTGMWLVPVTDQGPVPAQSLVPASRTFSSVEQNRGAIASASWSPQGDQVAYTFQAEAWVYDLDQSTSRQVTALAEQPLTRPMATEPFDGVREVAWAPDGASLALGLSCNCPSPWSGVGIVDIAGQEARLLVDGGQGIGWSPDGRWITFQNASGDWTGGSTFDFYGVAPGNRQITNLTRSNPGWDPLFPTAGTYHDAPYQTARLRWGPGGHFLFDALDYITPGSVAPQWGFVVKEGPETEAEARLGDAETWYVFPAWLTDGRYAYLEADAASSTDVSFAIRRAVVGQEAMPTERAYVHGAAWAPDGSAVALSIADGPASLPDRLAVWSLSLAPIGRTTEPAPTDALPPPLPPAPLPNGLALYPRERMGLLLLSLVQQVTTHVNVPVSGGMVHIAGAVPEGALTVPVVYYDGEQQALQLVSGEDISAVAHVPNLIALAGAPGQPVLAYTALEYTDQGLRSHLYAGTLQGLAAAAPALSVTSLESYALHPLAVRTEDGQPTGVWYTYAPYGIGGDIVFPPRSGLYYLALATGASTTVLGREMSPSSVSPDQAWIAFVPGSVGPLTIQNLATGKEIAFPLLPDSDRGAGRAVFSPDNQYVAWMEARGSMWADPSTFQTTVRIASIPDERIVDLPAVQIPDSVLPGIAGPGDMWLVPAGWLDGDTLLLQVSLGGPERSVVLQANHDGTGLEYLAPGILAGFLYPER